MKPGSYSCVCVVFGVSVVCEVWLLTKAFPAVMICNTMLFGVLWGLSSWISLSFREHFHGVFFTFLTCQPNIKKPAQDIRVPCAWGDTQSQTTWDKEPWKFMFNGTFSGAAQAGHTQTETHMPIHISGCSGQVWDPKQASGPHHWRAVQGRCGSGGGLCHRKPTVWLEKPKAGWQRAETLLSL